MEEKLPWKSSASKEKAFANPVYNSEAIPGRGSFGHCHRKMEVKEDEEEVLEEDGRYEEVDLGREKGSLVRIHDWLLSLQAAGCRGRPLK